MKALILAAGYATRLYPLTKDRPKPLLEVGSKTIADRIMEKLENVKEIDEVYLVTNGAFAPNFEKWAGGRSFKKKRRVINDQTFTNDTRLGAIGDIELVLEVAGIDDDLLVLGGDNLFDFELADFVNFARSKGGFAVALRDVISKEEAKRYGIVMLDKEERVAAFEEKPKEPASTLAAMCVYYFPKERLRLVNKYLKTGRSKDAPGFYIGWLAENDEVYGYRFEGEWFDIGDKRLLELADELYKKREGN